MFSGIDCSLKGEVWGWLLFYGGIASVAFGSAYYHLKPDDNRAMWDTLPVSIASLLFYLFMFLIFSFSFFIWFSMFDFLGKMILELTAFSQWWLLTVLLESRNGMPITQLLCLTQLFAIVEMMNFDTVVLFFWRFWRFFHLPITNSWISLLCCFCCVFIIF